MKKAKKENATVKGILYTDNKVDWAVFRDLMIEVFAKCESEQDFKDAWEICFLSCMKTPKEMAIRRERLGLKPFNEYEMDEIEEMEKRYPEIKEKWGKK